MVVSCIWWCELVLGGGTVYIFVFGYVPSSLPLQKCYPLTQPNRISMQGGTVYFVYYFFAALEGLSD